MTRARNRRTGVSWDISPITRRAGRTQSAPQDADDRRVKPVTSTVASPQPPATRAGRHPPTAGAGKASFAELLATLQKRGEVAHGVGASPAAGASTKPARAGEPGGSDEVESRSTERKRRGDTEEAAPLLDGAPFRPLPGCVFAPGVGRAPPLPPGPPPTDVTRMANELLRSVHVGGERGRGRVRLVLDGSRGGEPLQITLEETAGGVVATLPEGDEEGSRRLVRAIARELERRGIEVG